MWGRRWAVCGVATVVLLSGAPAASASVVAGARLASDGASAVRAPVAGYGVSDAVFGSLAPGARPYETATPAGIGSYGPIDSSGVRIFRMAGSTQSWDHPVAQAQYGIAMLNSYRLTREQRYLTAAQANAQRLVDRKVVSGTGWYFPYAFDYSVLGDTSVMLRAPWYSGMAQGQALSLFSRLYEVTGGTRWREAADRTYASLQQAPSGDAPFASWVDGEGNLWLEEYPRYPATASERVLNGHVFAIFGLYDYWQMTRYQPSVLPLMRGALRTVERTVSSQFRRPGWASVYSLYHAGPTFDYHKVHQDQMLLLWRMTRDAGWLRTAVDFRGDFPVRAVSGTVRFTPRTTQVYEVSASSTVTATRPVSIARETEAPFDARWRIKGGPVMLHITAGWMAGSWVEEKPGAAWAKGVSEVQEYAPAARLTFSAERVYTGYRLDAAGGLAESRSIRVRAGSAAPTSRSAWVLGQQAYLVTQGGFAGYWVPADPDVTPTGAWR